jgi:flagellar hook-associated protein 3 FlgL
MRVTFNSISDTLLGRLQSLGAQQSKALVELSSGQRISAPSDDAPAMQRVLNLRTEKKQNQQFYRNATDGLEKSQVTFSTLEQLKDLLVRSSELSANISGASSEQEYKAKAAEIDQLIQQGLNLGNTKLRGSYLFSGESTLQVPFQSEQSSDGKISAVAYNGSDDEAFMHVGEGEAMTISASMK